MINHSQLEANLRRLHDSLNDYVTRHGIVLPNSAPTEAASVSLRISLAHSTADRNFGNICASKQLLSSQRLAELRGAPLRGDSAEAMLGTGGFVFLYAAPFRYPATSCGLLFGMSLEREYQDGGVATPFDSGALVKHLARPDPDEPIRDFLARFELPLPDHREYLHRSLLLLFRHPLDYLGEVEPIWPGPIGLTGGDCRRWTHEVRIPDHVFVQSAHLQAVFARRALPGTVPAIEQLLRWCHLQGVDFVEFDSPRAGDFEALRRECVDYLRRRVLS